MRLYHIAVAALVLAPTIVGATPHRVEHWTATSTTAMAITGDIALSPTRLVTAGKSFPLEVAADITTFMSNTGPTAARILRVTRPMNPVLKNGNTLCNAPVRWIAAYRSDGGKSLNLAIFGGAEQPSGETGSDLCGTFLYSR